MEKPYTPNGPASGKSVFTAALEEASEDLEARVNSAGESADEPPAPEHDADYVMFEHQPRAGIGSLKGKSRTVRNAEHFSNRIDELQRTMGFKDPVLVLMEIANGQEVKFDPKGKPYLVEIKKLDYKTRAFAAESLGSYLYPKRKAVEVTGAEGQPISFAVHADNTPIPVMPSDAEIERRALERREQMNAPLVLEGKALNEMKF